MKVIKKLSRNTHKYYRPIVTALLIAGGAIHLAAPALADGTPAGTTISNTATAEYEDPNAPASEKIQATSNTVTVTVAEVAGITNREVGVTDSTPTDPVLPTDDLTYDFLITNVGNDTTTVTIPAPVITGPATQIGSITYEIDLNGDGTIDSTTTIKANAEAAILLPGGTIKVRVTVEVATEATSGAPIVVQLGDTPPNDNTVATQNQPVAGTGNVATVDAPNGTTGETTGAPSNGEREASATRRVLVGATPQAFATVLKTQGTYSNNSTPAAFNDDKQTYNLSLRVDSTGPSGASSALTPADLTGTTINVDGTPGTYILVSDAVPVNTTLSTATPTAPTGWTVVYTNSATTLNANAATTEWKTSRAAVTGTITRVGFINTGTVAKGTTVTGFSFEVITSGLTAATGGNIYNIAQVFGTSVGGGTTVVYDESGDQSPSNFNDNGTTGPGINNGVANPTVDQVDNRGDNTGTGPGGEDNVLILAPPGGVLNGPLNNPAAIGPTDNNDDFTNRSTLVPAGTAPGKLIDPAPVTFTNTLNAPTTALTNILLRPTGKGLPAGELPQETTATLSDGTNTAVYAYRGTDFVFISGNAIQIPNIPAGTSVNYTVVVDLPAGTPLSTDLPDAEAVKGFSVPISAFVNNDGNGVLDADESNNTTIDRLYTGFLRLRKSVRLLEADGTTEVAAYTETPNSATAINGEAFNTQLRSGRILQYKIDYQNISSPVVGTGNIIMDAKNVVITESGVLNTAVFPDPPTGNNWAQDFNPNGVIDTSNVVGKAIDTGVGATITYFSGTAGTTAASDQTGTTPANDVTKYLNTVTVPVTPQQTRTFTFQRKIN